MQPAGCRMERSQFPHTYGAPPSSPAIPLALPILAESALLRECDDPLRTERTTRVKRCDDSDHDAST